MGKNRKFMFGLGSLTILVRFCSGSEYFFKIGHVRLLEFLHIFTSGFGIGSVLGKSWVLVWFVLAGLGFFPISGINYEPPFRSASDVSCDTVTASPISHTLTHSFVHLWRCCVNTGSRRSLKVVEFFLVHF